MPKLSVIIVNYNTKEILTDCLKNLEGKYPGIEIIVVDNDSQDGSSDMIEESFPEVKLVKSKNNGLAAGYNLGINHANGEYILFLGSDAFPDKKTLLGLVDYLEEKPAVGLVTPKLVLRNGQLDRDAHRFFPVPMAVISYFFKLYKIFPNSKFFNKYYQDYRGLSTSHEIDMCISHFMMVRGKILNEIKWDEDFFVYAEDMDFCYRIKQAGWKIMYLPQFEAVHYKGVSVGTRKQSADITKASKKSKLKMFDLSARGTMLFYLKHYRNDYSWSISGLIIILSFLRSYSRKIRVLLGFR